MIHPNRPTPTAHVVDVQTTTRPIQVENTMLAQVDARPERFGERR
jgi:hypothetical protein